MANSLLGIRAVFLAELPLVHVPVAVGLDVVAGGRGGEAVDEDVLLGLLDALGLLQEDGEAALLALLLGGNEGLLAGLADEVDLGARGAADGEQAHDVGLGDDAQLGVGAADVAAPVGVVGDVGGGNGDIVVVGEGVLGAGRGVAEGGVQRDTGRAVGVDGEDAADALVDAGRLEGLFLRQAVSVMSWDVSMARAGWSIVVGWCGRVPIAVGGVCGAKCRGRVSAYLGELHDAASSFGNRLGGHVGGCEGERVGGMLVVESRQVHRLQGRNLLAVVVVGRVIN